MTDQNLSSFIWSVADLLRGDYKQSEYGKVILPFTVLRRLDCVLEGTKDAVLKEKEKREAAGLNPEPFLLKKSGQLFFNTSPLDMKKLMGDQDHIEEITRLFGECVESSRHIPCAVSPNNKTADGTRSDACYQVPISRLFKNEDFGYRTITVERPERDAAGKIVKATKGKLKGKPQPDANLRDTENVLLSEDVETYFKRELLPHAPDAWIDHEKTKVGYEIPFNRHFYVFQPPRELAEIDAELKIVTDRILTMIGGLTK
jgi:HsdM N-terminal domain